MKLRLFAVALVAMFAVGVAGSPPARAATPPAQPRAVEVPKPRGPHAAQIEAAKRAGVTAPSRGAASPASGSQAAVFNSTNAAGSSALDSEMAQSPLSWSTPPDNTGAIGPNHYVEMVNDLVTIYDRNLAKQSSQSLVSFTNDAGRNLFDVQVQWDQQGQRWFYAMDSVKGAGTPTDNRLDYGFSKSSDPTTGWCQYTIDTSPEFHDFPKLGHDDDFIYIGTNAFANYLSTTFVTSTIWAIAKPTSAPITTCPAQGTRTRFGTGASPLLDGNGFAASTPVPVNTTESSTLGYVVAAHDTANNVGSTHLTLWSITSNQGTPVLTSTIELTVNQYVFPLNAMQPGTQKLLDTSDGRLTQAVAHTDPDAGSLAIWTQHAITAGPTAGNSRVRWYEIVPLGNPVVRQQGDIVDNFGNSYFNAAISPATSGNEAVVHYDVSSSAIFPTIRAQSRTSGTPLGQMEGELTVKLGTLADVDFSCSGNQNNCRWGDYAGASPDPMNSHVVWGTNEWVGTPGAIANWATQNFALTPANLTLDPTAHDFGRLRLNASMSSSFDFTITNRSGSTAAIASVGVSGPNMSEFSATPGCTVPGTLAASGTCSVHVVFTPVGSPGTRSAALTVTSDQGNPSAGLTGAGIFPNAQLSPSSHDFGNQTVNMPSGYSPFTLSNPGLYADVLNISGITITGVNMGDFSEVTTCSVGGQLAANTNCIINVRFTPSALRLRTAYLNVNDDSGSGTQSANLMGNGTSPACSTPTLMAAPSSPQAPGPTVTITATTGACPVPEYRFFEQLPGSSSWNEVQPYSASNTFSWNTSGQPLGTYGFAVWVREQTSLAPYDSYSSFFYTLAVQTCTFVYVNIYPPPPASAGAQETVGAGSYGCSQPEYRFWLQKPGGAWQIFRDYGPSPIAWDTTGLPAGTYYWAAWARQQGSSNAYDAYSAPFTFVIPACSSVSITAGSPGQPSPPGTTVGFAAAGDSGCTPVFKFLTKAPNSSTWVVAQDYSTNRFFYWNTTALPTGTYGIAVWVRDAGQTDAYEAYAGTSYTLALPPCTGVGLSAMPASPEPAGTQETVSGSASGCPQPEYRFFLQNPGGAYVMTRDYMPTSWSWDTTNLASGTYGLAVWARQQGSGASYEVYTSISFVIPACSSVGLSSGSPGSPQPHGTKITFMGSATGCGQPVFEFWTKAPNGSWVVAQAYSSNSTFSWDTSALSAGTYGIAVWVKEQGSPAAYDAYTSTTYTLT